MAATCDDNGAEDGDASPDIWAREVDMLAGVCGKGVLETVLGCIFPRAAVRGACDTDGDNFDDPEGETADIGVEGGWWCGIWILRGDEADSASSSAAASPT